VRYFLAVYPPRRLQAKLIEAQALLESKSWDLDPHKPETFHITLHFLGETPDKILPDLHHDLKALAGARRGFDIGLGGLGAFESWQNPRVIWARPRDPQGLLAELEDATRKRLNAYRLFKLREGFVPHLTLAHVRDLRPDYAAPKLEKLAEEIGELGVFHVDDFRLIRMLPGRHELVESYPLNP
jgi:2'-5' RNA ligase